MLVGSRAVIATGLVAGHTDRPPRAPVPRFPLVERLPGYAEAPAGLGHAPVVVGGELQKPVAPGDQPGLLGFRHRASTLAANAAGEESSTCYPCPRISHVFGALGERFILIRWKRIGGVDAAL